MTLPLILLGSHELSVGPPPLTIAGLTYAVSTADATTQSFASRPTGDKLDPDNYLLVFVGGLRGASSLTIGASCSYAGVSLPRLAQVSQSDSANNNTCCMGIYGGIYNGASTTGSVSVTFSANTVRAGMAAFKIKGSVAPVIAVTTKSGVSGGDLNWGNITIPEGGVCGAGVYNSDAVSHLWNGLIEYNDTIIESGDAITSAWQGTPGVYNTYVTSSGTFLCGAIAIATPPV